jgi:predicted transcriptional regulator
VSATVETIAVTLEADAFDRLKRAAAEIGMTVEAFIASAAEQVAANNEAQFGSPLSDEQVASIRRGLEDVAAGRTFSHDEVFGDLKARYGR